MQNVSRRDTIRRDTPQTSGSLPAPAAGQIVGFRVMRETETAPHWWAKPIEIGETVSGPVAFGFCDEQNKVTMNLDRVKRHRYFVEPVYGIPDSTADSILAALAVNV